jgi:hypothetical protein
VPLFPQRLETGFWRDRKKPVSACWDGVPNHLNSPVAGVGCTFDSRTLLFPRPLQNEDTAVLFPATKICLYIWHLEIAGKV